MLVLFTTLLFGCSNETKVEEPAPVAAATDPAPAAEPTPEPPPIADDAPPPGRIGGDPILDHPVVLGSIDNKAVDAGLEPHQATLIDCFTQEQAKSPGLHGKVLVKFTIDKDGAVTNSETLATSMRHPPTESCLNGVIAKASFPPLTLGAKAIVKYPFSFPTD